MHIIRLLLLLLSPLSALMAIPPNVVMIITDDQGYGDLSCHGNPILKTPALDDLYTESVRLNDYHVSPTCAPTRSALMSGHYTNRASAWHTIMGRSFLRLESTTLGEVFKDNGYRTGHFGKWHLGDNYPYRPEDRGFDEVLRHGGGGVGQAPDFWNNAYFDDTYLHNGEPVSFEGYCTDIFFSQALRFISESAAEQKPFFAYISTNAPHGPLHVEDKYWKPYLEQGLKGSEAVFFGMIANIDDNVAKLRKFLEERGLSENTILIFTTDNGTASGKDIFNAGMRGTKGSAYDGGHRVPFFLHWPKGGLIEGKDVKQLTAHIDVLPTLIELCGLKSPSDYSFDGRSLVPLIYDLQVPWPERTIVTDSQRVRDPIKWRNSSTMTQRWRLINGEELYDMETDPGQQMDVAPAHPDVVARLRSDYDVWWESVSESFSSENRIIIGNPSEDPVHLSSHDWLTLYERTPFNQRQIREGVELDGYWALETESAGRYQVALSRWPTEINHPIRAGLPAGDPVPGLKAHRETPGRAMNIVKAVLMVDWKRFEQKVEGSMAQAVFEVELPAGNVDLHGQFILESGTKVGSYYATIKRFEKRPNVVILYADDMGVGDVSYGDPEALIQTPNIDRLAAEGMSFTDGHSSSGVCTPSRFALLTGQHHWRRFHGIVGAFGKPVFMEGEYTIARMFQENGYNTACIGKWHLGWDWDAIRNPDVAEKDREAIIKAESYDWTKPFPGGPLERGFDYYFGDGTINFPPYCWIENDRFLTIPSLPVMQSKPLAGAGSFRPGPMAEGWDPYKVLPTITGKAVEWISKQSNEKPFLLYLAFNSPHYPIVPNKEFHGKSEAGYYGDFVIETDAMVGKVMDALKAASLDENTMVIFSADNGAEMHAFERLEKFGQWSSGPFRGVKRDLYEGGHRVPFIVRWPGKVKGGTTSGEVVSQVDLAATFATMINHPLGNDEAIDSYNLLPALLGEEYDSPLRIATVQNTMSGAYAIRQGDWVLIDAPSGASKKELKAYLEHFHLDPFGEDHDGLLFNIREDTRQLVNLYEQYPDKVESMRRLLKSYLDGERCAPERG